MSANQTMEHVQPKKFPVRTILLILAVIAVTVFAMNNRAPVQIWPIGQRSVFMVILISFVLGLLIGVLAHSMFSNKMRLAPDERIMERNNH